MRRTFPAWAWACLCAAQAACAANISGVVYIDRNGDRLRQDDEPVVPGAIVMLDHGTASARTDRVGAYTLDAPAGAGIVWVRVPAGFRPGPVWGHAGGRV